MAKKATKSAEGNVLTFEFVNGETLTFDISTLAQDMLQRLAIHGGFQKLGDSYAGAKSVEDAITSVKRVWEELVAGNWTAARTAGTGGARIGQLAKALARVASKDPELGREVTVEEAVEIVSEMDDDQKKAIRSQPAIKAAIAQIRLEEAQAEAQKATEEGGEQPSLASLLAG